MECRLCRSMCRKFVCVDCIRDRYGLTLCAYQKVGDYRATISQLDRERKRMAGRRPTGIKADKEHSSLKRRLHEVENLVVTMKSKLEQDRSKLRALRTQVESRRKALEAAQADLKRHGPHVMVVALQEVEQAFDNYRSTVDVLIQSRRILVRELVSAFRLRRVQRVAPQSTVVSVPVLSPPRDDALASTSSDKYRKMVGSSPNYDDPQNTESLMLELAHNSADDINTHYLGVRVPFELISKGAKSYAKGNPDSLHASRDLRRGMQMPLYLSDSNIEAFTVGLAMLNFDIAYLCHSQGVVLPISGIPNTLENLALCCRASKMGRYIFFGIVCDSQMFLGTWNNLIQIL
ncbi:hypothetical protein BC829DRAFT_381585 [Chytridium lagenaria]|nr:hypothetical protein BC829DRAFT_381585 [Chytridium lagenaria]